MKAIVGIALAAALAGAGASAATVTQNRAPTADEVAALKAQVSALRGEVSDLKQAYARHYHRYNTTGGSPAAGDGRTSPPAN